MDYKEINDVDKEYIKKVYLDKDKSWDERINAIMQYIGKSERTCRKWLVKLGFKHKEEIKSDQYDQAKKRIHDDSKKRFIITWGQNATPIHKKFFNNIIAYSKFIDADIHVIAGRYKNPTSLFCDKDDDYWVSEIAPYLDANRHDIHRYVSILSDIKIQPTADNPMSGLQGITGINSCIVGSPRVHMEVLPALEGYIPKVMFSTGAVTVKNYVDSKAGKKGEFHHTLGFVVVEIKDDNLFFARQVTAHHKTGEFTDLYYKVKDENVEQINSIQSLIMGDIHLGQTCEKVEKATDILLSKLKPNHVILHDIFDGYSINHHEMNNPFAQYEKHKNGTNLLKAEVDNMLNWLKKMTKYKLVIVRSNHDDFVDRWLINVDWKKHIHNGLEYMEYAKAIMTGDAPKGIIPYIINKTYPDIICLDRSENYRVSDWELGVHGDIGSNGSRGSLEQFRKLNTKIVVGHYHSPARKDGSLAVGTSTKLRMGYNLGASNWLNSHVIIHNDGKAQHINIIKGEYTTF